MSAHPRAAYRELGDGQGAVVLQLESGGYHGLNAMGSYMWGVIGDEPTLEELITRVRDHVTDPPDHLEEDVISFVETLRDRELVVVLAPGA